MSVEEMESTMQDNFEDSPEIEAGEKENSEGKESTEDDREYEPNYKFNHHAKELEFDDWAKGHITNKASEEKFRDLFERAYGLDVVKSDREALREHNSQLMDFASEGEQLKTELGEVGNLIRSGNMMQIEEAFERLNIPENVIYQYALHRLKLKDAPPEHQQAYQQQRERQSEMSNLQQQNEFLQSQFSNFQVSQRTSEMDQALNSPEVSSAAEYFDQRAGYQGAFKDEVIKQGRYHYLSTKQDLPVRDAVQRVLSLVGNNAPQQQNYNRAAGVNVTPRNNRPHLPNIRGSGQSPIKSMPRSIADIRRLAEQAASRG
jgi:hypothetical protein